MIPKRGWKPEDLPRLSAYITSDTEGKQE